MNLYTCLNLWELGNGFDPVLFLIAFLLATKASSKEVLLSVA